MSRALIRGNDVLMEPFSPWVTEHMDFLIKHDGWKLEDNYNPEMEDL